MVLLDLRLLPPHNPLNKVTLASLGSRSPPNTSSFCSSCLLAYLFRISSGCSFGCLTAQYTPSRPSVGSVLVSRPSFVRLLRVKFSLPPPTLAVRANLKCFVASYFERFFFSGKSSELDTAVRTCLPGPVLVRSLTLGQPWTGSVGIAWASDNKALWRSLAIGLPEPVFDEK